MPDEQLHVVLNPVRADRAGDFESFLTDVVAPAVRAQRPDLDGRWQVFRSPASEEGTVTFVFLLDGGSLEEDWELDRILPAHLGQEEAERLVTEWTQSFTPLQTWADA